MPTYALEQLTLEQLGELVEIDDRDIQRDVWELRPLGQLTDDERAYLAFLHQHLTSFRAHLANEATVWARAIYPLLVLAERDGMRAFSGVPLSALVGGGELRGELDGALAHAGIQADAGPPYLLVAQAKRRADGNDLVARLLGGLLRAAATNHRLHRRAEHVLYGAYTIADVWTFVRATITGMDSGRPAMTTVSSGEYSEATDAEKIALLLKSMVAELLA